MSWLSEAVKGVTGAVKKVTGPITLGNVLGKAAGFVPGGNIIKTGLNLASTAKKLVPQSAATAIVKAASGQGPQLIPKPSGSSPSLGNAMSLTGMKSTAGSQQAAQQVQQIAQQLLPQLAPTPTARTMTLVPMGNAPSQNAGAYDAVDQLLGGWLPGGTYGPGGTFNGLNLQGSGGAVVPGSGAAGVLSGQVPIITRPNTVSVLRAPQGYVLVKGPNGQVVAMLKPVAYALGFRKRPSRRGGISGKEVSSARKVNRLLMELTVGRKPKSALKTKGKR